MQFRSCCILITLSAVTSVVVELVLEHQDLALQTRPLSQEAKQSIARFFFSCSSEIAHVFKQ